MASSLSTHAAYFDSNNSMVRDRTSEVGMVLELIFFSCFGCCMTCRNAQIPFSCLLPFI
jgi:hypothetical protein